MALELRRGTPHPALAGVAIRYEGFAHRAGGPVRFLELPCTHVPVIVDLGSGWGVSDGRSPDAAPAWHGSFVAGLTDGPVRVEHRGEAECLQIDLTPLGARRLLGVPMHELANRTVDLGDVLRPSAARELVARIAEARSWGERFALVDRALARRMGAAPLPGREMSWALSRVAAGAPVGEVARELGWSHRRLIGRFRDQVGLPPKRVGRIARLERLVAELRGRGGGGWARLAAACGYFDQPHLAREVRELTGLTPTALRAEVNSVQDPARDPP
jgi:AraC-like DNA-binding protein